MNCWIILLLLSCWGRNNGVMQRDMGCACDCNDNNNHSSCIQSRMYEKDSCNMRRERDCDCDDFSHNHTNNDAYGCNSEERTREKWMPYSECNDNDRRDFHDSCRNERERSCDCK